MAVNDLMMRIQLLVDSGKSSAELNRVQSSLNALTKDLNRLSQIKLNLKDQLAGLAELGSKLKQVNLGNFATSITDLEKAFGKMNLPTTQLTKLRDAFQNLSLEKVKQSTSSYAKDLEKVNQQLKDAKKYTLTNDRQVFNSSLAAQNQLLIANASKVKNVNDYIVTQRKEIAKLNEQLKNSVTLYAAQRQSQGQLSLFSLNRGLELDTAKTKLWAEELNKAKSNLVVAKDNLKEIKQEASQLTKQKILDFGIADSDKNAGAIRSTIAEMNRLTVAIDTQKLRLDAFKSFKPIKTILLEEGLTKNDESLRATNKLIDEQKIKTAQLATSKLLAAQATDKELNSIKLINNQLRMDEYAKSNSANYIAKLKDGIVDLNKQVTALKATDFSSFAQPILDATSKVNAAKEAYQQLKVETLRAAAAVKTASVVDPTAYKSAIDLLKTYREDVIQSAKVLADNKSKLSNVRDELRLVNQEYRDFAAKLREAKQLAKSFQLPSQQTQLAEYTRLNQELDDLKNRRTLFKTNEIDPAIDKVRALRNQIKAVGTDDASVSLFKNANQQILNIKEQLNNLKFGGVKGTLDLGSLITQFGQLQSGGRSLESIAQRMLELRTQIKSTKPDVEALKQTLFFDKEKILIGKESIANAQKSLSDLNIAAKAARDGVLTELAPIANQLKSLGETRISKANLTEGLLNEVSRLKKALNDIQPQGMESIRKETDKLNASLTALRFGNEKGIIPVGQIDEGKKSIAALKQQIDALRVSAKTVKLSDSFFTNTDAPNFANLFKTSGLDKIAAQNDKLRGSFDVSVSSWKEYASQVQVWTSRLREGQSQIVNLRNEVNSLKNVGDQSVRVLSDSIRNTRLEMQKAGTVNFNQAFRDEGVVNLLDRMNQVKKSIVDIQKVSAGQQKPVLNEADLASVGKISKLMSAVTQLGTAYSNLGGAYKAANFKDIVNEISGLDVDLGKKFKFNLNENSIKQRLADAVTSLSSQANAITVPIELKGLAEITNQIRKLSAEKGLEKALNVDTVSASAKAIKSEIDLLKELRESKRRSLETDKLSQAEVDAHETRITQLKSQLAALGKYSKDYETTSLISAKIIELEGKNVSLKFQAADAAKKIADNQSVAIAKLREQEAIGKNNLNNLSQEAKELNQIIAAERNRTKLAKESQRTTLLGLTGDLNTTKSAIGNRTKEIADQQSLNTSYRLGLTLLSDFGKSVKSNANEAYVGIQKQIGGLLEQLGLLKRTESSYLKQLAEQRDLEKASKSAAQTAKDAARLSYNAAQLESETNQNAIRGSRERASALRDISSAIRANATVASLANANEIRSGESLITQLKRQYQQYQANESATRNSIAAKKTTSDASLSGLYEELAGLQRQRVALLDVQGILRRRGADQALILKTESARQAGLREELRIQKQLADIAVTDKKSIFSGIGDQIKSAVSAMTALKNAAKGVATGLTISDVGGTEVLERRVSLTQRLRDLTKETLAASLRLNQDRSTRDTQASTVKDVEAQVKATKALATAELERRKNLELNAQSSVVTAKQVLAAAQQEEKAAKTRNEIALAGLNTKIAENTVAIATAKQNVTALETEITKRNEAIAAIREQQALRVAAVAKDIEALNIAKALTTEEKARLTTRKNDLNSALDKENASRKQSIDLLRQQIEGYKAQQIAATKGLDDLIAASRKSNLESQRAVQSDIVGRENSIKLTQQALEAVNKKILADKEAVKQYQIGLKEYEKGIRASIAEANQRIASGQLTKTQLAEERQGIKELVKEQQNLSKAYIARLNEQATNLQSSLKGERERIKLLEQQAKAETDAVQKQVLMTAALKARNELTKVGGQEQSLTRQIQETGDLAKAEMQRLSVLERLATAGQKQNFNASIKETERLVQETTKRLDELSKKSDAAKTKLSAIGSTSDLPTVGIQIKQAVADLKSLKQVGLSGTQAYSDIERQLAGLREQRVLLRQIASIDTKTASGKVELGDLTKQINQLRESQREMSKLNQFAQEFKQGFNFALTPDQLGMAAFNMIQQALSELGRKFIEVNAQSETLIRGLSAVFGAGQGEVQFEKLTKLANTYGLALHDLSRNYLSLNASSKGTILEGVESEKIFRSLAAAMAVLGADTISTQRAFRAVSQMISKGQVYAEELKGQLAESLPGAVQLFARSMGKTTQEFLAMVKAGQVGLNELIPFFGLIQQEYGNAATASTTWEQAINRSSNAWSLLLKNIGDTGVWKEMVAVVNAYAKYVQDAADSIKPSIGETLNKLNEEKFNLKPIVIPTKLEFDNFPDVQLGTKSYKIVGKFIFENYEEAKSQIDAINKANKDRVDIIDDETKSIEKLARKNVLDAQAKRLIDLNKEIADSYKAIEETRKLVSKDKPSAALAILGVTPSISFNEQEAKNKINAIYKKIAVLMNQAKTITKASDDLKVQIAEDEKSKAIDNARLAFTKKQIREEQNALNIRQQSYLTLSSIQQNLLQRDLKATGVSDVISTEVQSVAKLTEVYKQLAIAKEIESRIISNPNDSSKDTTEADAEAIRKLTIDQLKHTQTVARGANNLSVQLRIMMEIERIQRTITEKTTANTVATNASGVASQSVLDKTKALSISLSNATTKGYGFARAIADGLSYTEQMNALLSQQKVLIAQSNNEKLKSKITNKEEIKQAEDTAKAIKKSQEDGGEYFTPEKQASDLAYMSKREYFANAEESWAAARKSNNDQEKAQLIEITKENLDLAKAKALEAGDTYGLKQIQAVIEELRLYKEGVNAAEIAKQQAALGETFKFDENNKFDLTKSLGDFRTAFNEQLKIRQDAIKAISGSEGKLSESDKAAYQKVIDDANAKINALNAIYPKLEEAAKNAGQTIPVDIKAVIPQEVLDAERLKLETMTKDIPANVNLTYNGILESLPDISQRVNLVYSGNGGGGETKARWGGYIPGWGGGDRVRALLEPGEFVLRKEAVQALGLEQISKWNRLGGNLRMPRSVDSISIPHFASGGLVGGSPITINVPGSKSIQVSGSRESAMALANLLTRVGRAV